jgi:RHS repeat-associated protein
VELARVDTNSDDLATDVRDLANQPPVIRYVNLGRRVWVRAYRNAYCPGPRDRDSTSVCISSVERSIYDGDQVLLEIRQPGDDTISTAVLESDGPAASTPRRYFGTVGYLHGPGIDHPLGLVRNYNGAPFPIIAHYHGLYGLDGATRLDGTIVSPCTSSLACYDDQLGDQPDFVGRRMSYGFVITSPSEGPVSWWGTMANMKENATGVLDMRSRVYDPRTGRFTQEDPIGLAGGMNLYGFAGGDPVNFSDPLGLCPVTPADPTPCGLTGAAVGGVAGAGIGVAITAGCASVTVGLCAGGAPMIISATAGLGTVIGGAIGTAITLLNNDGDPVGASGGERAGKGFTPGEKEKIRGPEGTPCTYCGGPTTRQPGATQSHGEHVIPRADGGNGSRDNGVNACRTCNLDKGKRSPSEWKPRWYDPPKQP